MTGSKGVTLIELLVGIACFSIVIALVTGIFVTALSAKKQVKELSLLQDEARYIMDYMSREIRVSKIDIIADKKLEIQDKTVVYEFENNSITRNDQSLNSNAVQILDGDFDGEIATQPKVTITMTLQSVKNPSLQIFISTTISSRSY